MARTILRAGRIAAGAIITIGIAGLLLYAAGVFTVAQTSPPPAPDDAGVAETLSVESTVYTPEQLELLAVVDEKPGTYEALMALKKLTVQHIAADQDALAADTLAQLVGPFVDSPHLPGNMHDIVRTAAKEGKSAVVGQLCEALASQPGQPQGAGVWLGMAEVLAGVHQGDDAAVDAATQQMVAAHGTDARCVEAFGQIAYAFRQLKKYERSRQCYQSVVDTWPHGPRAVFSQRGLVWVNEALGDEAAAFAALNTLLAEYTNDPDLVECVRQLADSYEQKKDYNTTIRIHQYVSDTRPEDGMAVWSQFKVFKIALTELKDDVLADRAYQQIWDRFRGHSRIAQVVCEAAWEYRKLNRHAEALEMYRAAQAAQPDNDRAIIAQRGIVYCLLALQDYPPAVAEAQKLFAAFPDDKQLPLTAIEVGDALGWAKLYPEALTMYQYIVNNHPNDSRAITAQRKVATAYINIENEPAAQQAIDTLTVTFADDPRLGNELYTIGECYRTRKDYAAAEAVYDYVAAEFPDTKDAMWSSQRLILMAIDENDDPNSVIREAPPGVLQAVDNLTAAYGHIPELAQAVFYLGEDYWQRIRAHDQHETPDKNCYNAPIAIWHKAINDAPFEKTYTPFAWYMCAHCYQQTAQYDEAIACYQKLTEDAYRNAKYSHRAPFQLGEIYKYHKKQFETAAYWYDQQNILYDPGSGPYGQKFVCDDAMFALGTVYRLDLKDYDKAIAVYETYLHTFPRGQQSELMPLLIARCYAGKGDFAKAIEIVQGELTRNPDMKWAAVYQQRLAEFQRGGQQ